MMKLILFYMNHALVISRNNTNRLAKSVTCYRKVLVMLGGFLLMTATTGQLFSQSIISGDITGTVTDPTGAVIPSASVTATNIGTNVSVKTVTNGDGSY